MAEPLYDVIEVSLTAPHPVRIIDTDKTMKNAEAVMKMAVARRRVEGHFFQAVTAGKYRDGDVWEPR